MANGLFTGIALSGKEKVDNSGQQYLLEAEKAAAQQRLAAEAQAKKDREELEKGIMKDLSITPKLATPYYQRQFAKRVQSDIADIVEASKTGDGNLAVIGSQKVQQLKNYQNAVQQADAQLQSTLQEVAKDPNSYAFLDEQTIGGKTYKSFYEAINDPYFDTPEGRKEVMSKYGGTEYVFQENDPNYVALGMPDFIVGYEPRKMTDPFDKAREIAKSKNMFTEIKQGKTFPLQGTRKRITEFGYGIPQEQVDLITENVMNDPQVLRFYEEKIYKEQKKQNPDLTKAQFLSTDWEEQIPDMIQNDVATPLNTWLENKTLKEATIDQPKETKATTFKQKYIPSEVSKVEYADTTANRLTYNATGTRGKVAVFIPNDTQVQDADGNFETYDLSKSKTEEMSPIGVEWRDNKLYFLFQKDDKVLFIPQSKNSFESFTSGLFIKTPEDKAEVIEQIKSVAEQNPAVLEKEFWKKMGVSEQEMNQLGGFGASMPKAGTSQERPKEESTEMITIVLDGKTGQIPADKIDAFLKKYPNAKRQ